MSVKKRRPPLLLPAFVIIVVLLMTFQSRLGIRNTAAFALFSPVFSAFNAVSDGIKGIWTDYLNLVDTEEENRQLKLRIQKLELERNRIHEIRAENLRLRGLLELKVPPSYSMVAAEVIARSPVDGSHTLTIDKGTRDGVDVNRPVMGTRGLIGRIYAVSSASSKVLLITDPRSSVAIRFQDSREEAIMDGADKLCTLKYVHKDAPIKVGERVVTSGLDDLYPKGMPVGSVLNVEKLEHGIFQNVDLTPFEDFHHMEEVFIVLEGGDTEE